MGKWPKTLKIIETAIEILAYQHPMTVRQIYYQLVSRQVIQNNRSQYQAVSNAIVDARKDGEIPWEYVEDRLRVPRQVPMWDDLPDFAKTAQDSYRRDVWAMQPRYIECWLEKDALSGIIQDVLYPYGVTLNVGRGYDGWASIRNAAGRYSQSPRKHVTVLYFGDFDPSGEDMVRSLDERIRFFYCYPEIVKCALTLEDVETYNLPPDATKVTDTRRDAFIAINGDRCVELDALPVDILRTRVITEIERRINIDALKLVRHQEDADRAQLVTALQGT